MDAVHKGWFSELSTMWPGQCLSLQVDEVLCHDRSKYQDVMVLQTKSHGRALILDGVIQLTERDEFGYQEMLASLPINCHPNPEKVLIIGGGDGGITRELDRYPSVKEVVMCEIDEKVIEVTKKYLPFMAKGFESPKLRVHVGDGFQFVREHQAQFDVIITDSSDPVGPAEALFEREYYAMLKTALRGGGILISQAETIWLNLDLIKTMVNFCEELFPVVDYAQIAVPTYPSGQIGCLMCSINPDMNFRKPLTRYTAEQVREMGWKYYNSEIHEASFVMPQFAQQVLSSEKWNGTKS